MRSAVDKAADAQDGQDLSSTLACWRQSRGTSRTPTDVVRRTRQQIRLCKKEKVPLRRYRRATSRLRLVLESYAARTPGYFVYFPSRAQRSDALRLFIDAAKELSVRAMK